MVAPFNRVSKRHCREGLFDFEMATKSACSTGPSSETFPSLASLCCKESSSWSSACNARYSSIAAFAACVVVSNTIADTSGLYNNKNDGESKLFTFTCTYAGDNPNGMHHSEILASPPVPFGAIGFTCISRKMPGCTTVQHAYPLHTPTRARSFACVLYCPFSSPTCDSS